MEHWFIAVNWFTLHWSTQKRILKRLGRLKEYEDCWRKSKAMKMKIGKNDGDTIQKEVPKEFVPFKSGLAGQDEQHAVKLESWIKNNLSIKCSYVGVMDGIVYLTERQ